MVAYALAIEIEKSGRVCSKVCIGNDVLKRARPGRLWVNRNIMSEVKQRERQMTRVRIKDGDSGGNGRIETDERIERTNESKTIW